MNVLRFSGSYLVHVIRQPGSKIPVRSKEVDQVMDTLKRSASVRGIANREVSNYRSILNLPTPPNIKLGEVPRLYVEDNVITRKRLMKPIEKMEALKVKWDKDPTSLTEEERNDLTKYYTLLSEQRSVLLKIETVHAERDKDATAYIEKWALTNLLAQMANDLSKCKEKQARQQIMQGLAELLSMEGIREKKGKDLKTIAKELLAPFQKIANNSQIQNKGFELYDAPLRPMVQKLYKKAKRLEVVINDAGQIIQRTYEDA